MPLDQSQISNEYSTNFVGLSAAPDYHHAILGSTPPSPFTPSPNSRSMASSISSTSANNSSDMRPCEVDTISLFSATKPGSCEVTANFRLDAQVEPIYGSLASRETNMQELLNQLNDSGFGHTERLLHNLRIKTAYIRDSKEIDGVKVKLIKVRGFGRQTSPRDDGALSTNEGLSMIDAPAREPDDAENLHFRHDGSLISVDGYLLFPRT